MELYGNKFNLDECHRKLLWPVEDILSSSDLIISDCYSVFEERKGLSVNDIKNILIKEGISFNGQDLFEVLQILQSNFKRIVRDEFWDKDTQYRWLDRQLWEHKSQEVHYSFDEDGYSDKTFLVISDTHIGHDIFSGKLIHNLYDYAILNGATHCFHLGDLFHGCRELSGNIYELYSRLNSKLIDDFEEEFNRQISIFINEYPKTDEMKTYCVQGNHDEAMDRFLKFRNWCEACDLRKLSIYNPNLYIFPRPHFVCKLNEYETHFNHRLYMSAIMDDFKIDDIGDIEKKKEFFGSLLSDSHYDLLFSGHLHRGIVYSDKDLYRGTNKLYVGVPSSSIVNLGRTVAYLVNMNENIMNIQILGCDENMSISVIDEINWDLYGNNKQYCKTL